MLAAFPFRLNNGAHLSACIAGIKIVEHVTDGSEIILAFLRINAVIDRDESDIAAGKYDFRILA